MGYLIICLVCFAVYWRSLTYGLVVDDRRSHKYPLETHRFHWRRIIGIFKGGQPIKTVWADHLLTIVLHASVCCLMYKAFGSLVASLLFAVNVSNNQVSLWLNGKRYGVNTILCLLAWIYAPFGILFWFICPLFQISALTFPVLLVFKGCWWLCLLIPLYFFVDKKRIIHTIKKRARAIPLVEWKKWHWNKPILILKTIAFYFFHGLYPFVPFMYHRYMVYLGQTEQGNRECYKIDFMFCAGLLIVLGIPIIWFFDKTIGLGLIWWLVTIAVFSNAVTITMVIGERYMYLPNVGLMVALGAILNYIHPLAWIFVFAFYLARLLTYMPMYRDMDSYMFHHTFYEPKLGSTWNFRINLAVEDKDVIYAHSLCDEALKRCGDDPRFWIHKGAILNALGQKEKARICLHKARETCEGTFKELLKPEIDKLEDRIKNSFINNGGNHGSN